MKYIYSYRTTYLIETNVSKYLIFSALVLDL